MANPEDLPGFASVVTGGILPTSCTQFINCFNSASATAFVTDRWYFVLVQGVVMGLVIDVGQFNFFLYVTKRLTSLENWPTEEEFNRPV